LGYTTGGTKTVTKSGSEGLAALLARMALIAIVIGTSVTISATERVNAAQVFGGAVGWSFVPLLQLLTGLLLVRGARGGRIELLARYFRLHQPWCLWILIAHAILLMVPIARSYQQWMMLTLIVPMMWTFWFLLRFCREELRLDGRSALRRVLLHQSATYAIAFAYVFAAVALWPRILGLFR
jgi:hypothetical protein